MNPYQARAAAGMAVLVLARAGLMIIAFMLTIQRCHGRPEPLRPAHAAQLPAYQDYQKRAAGQVHKR